MKLEPERFWEYFTKKAKKYMVILQHHAEGVEGDVNEEAMLEDEFVEYSKNVDPFGSPSPTK